MQYLRLSLPLLLPMPAQWMRSTGTPWEPIETAVLCYLFSDGKVLL